MELEPIGEPVNVLVRLTDDTLPSPDAIMVTGITPQETLADGISEVDFSRMLMREIFTPGTVAVGYNNVRFDDEFIRHSLWRNFYDPYEWAWSEGRSRWDLLDVVRMTRALRPEGIKWPVDKDGRAVNKLELLSKENGLVHTKAHDALSDVEALIGMAKLIRTKQPKLFDFLLSMREKKKVMELINLDDPKPFVYSSGRYDMTFEKTTVAFPVAPGAKPGSVIVYDLRYDPTEFLHASPAAVASIIFADRSARAQEGFRIFPAKELSYNKCPAVAPLGVLDASTKERLSISLEDIQRHMQIILKNPGFGDTIREAFKMREPYEPSSDVEGQLYDGFINDKDKGRIEAVRGADATELADFHPQFIDGRLDELLLRYKARQFPTSLSEDEYEKWEIYRADKLQQQLPVYMAALTRLAEQPAAKMHLLEDLQLWAESIMPV